MPRQLRSIFQKDFSGGGNWITSFLGLKENQLVATRNMALTIHGEMMTRPGLVLAADVQSFMTDTVDHIVTIDILNKTDFSSTGIFITQEDAAAGHNHLFKTVDGTTWTEVNAPDPFVQNWALPFSIPFVDKLVITNGPADTPRLFDGTNLTKITALAGQTVPPGAMHAISHYSSLWLWGTSPTTTALDGLSSLRMSAPDDPNDWPDANQVFIAKDDGQIATGQSIFTIAETGISPTSVLTLFKNFSTYQVQGVMGDPPSDDFQVQRVKTDMGCIAPRSVQFVSGFGVIRLTHKGFALYDGVNDHLISEEIRPLIFGEVGAYGLTFSGINFTPTEDPAGNDTGVVVAWSMQSQNPPLYICGCPTNDPQDGITRIFVYDLVRRAWLLWDFPFIFSSFSMHHFGLQATEKKLFGGTLHTGKIYEFKADAFTDAGIPIPWEFITRPFFPGGDPHRIHYWRRFQGMYNTRQSGASQNATLDFYFPNRPRQTITYSTEGDPGIVISSFCKDLHTKSPFVIIHGHGAGAIRWLDLEFQYSTEDLTCAFWFVGQSAQPLPPVPPTGPNYTPPGNVGFVPPPGDCTAIPALCPPLPPGTCTSSPDPCLYRVACDASATCKTCCFYFITACNCGPGAATSAFDGSPCGPCPGLIGTPLDECWRTILFGCSNCPHCDDGNTFQCQGPPGTPGQHCTTCTQYISRNLTCNGNGNPNKCCNCGTSGTVSCPGGDWESGCAGGVCDDAECAPFTAGTCI